MRDYKFCEPNSYHVYDNSSSKCIFKCSTLFCKISFCYNVEAENSMLSLTYLELRLKDGPLILLGGGGWENHFCANVFFSWPSKHFQGPRREGGGGAGGASAPPPTFLEILKSC